MPDQLSRIARPDSPVRVLTVDDDRVFLERSCAVLAECGYSARPAQNAPEALDVVRSGGIDVILCDLILPGISGLDVLKTSRTIDRNVMVIMMSARADLGSLRKAVELGASDFLVKPFRLAGLPFAIHRNLLQRQIAMTRQVEQRNRLLMECIKALSAAMGAREHGTAEHCERIGPLALMIAEAMGLSEADKSSLELAAYIHDIGKIAVRDEVLLKPGGLSDVEWDQVRMHPDTGSRILAAVEELSEVAAIVRHHHERVDGTGYPDGLAGQDIPILSRILAVADAFDAMTSDRPYRRSLSTAEAVARLREGAGS